MGRQVCGKRSSGNRPLEVRSNVPLGLLRDGLSSTPSLEPPAGGEGHAVAGETPLDPSGDAQQAGPGPVAASADGTVDNTAVFEGRQQQQAFNGADGPAATTTGAEPRQGSRDSAGMPELEDFIELSGLDRYDPDLIRRIYRVRPLRLLRRLWQTLIPIGIYLLRVLLDQLSGRLGQQRVARARAKELTALLAQLGPAFIKAGQALSTRPDLVPPIALEELAALQDQLPPFPTAVAMACIEEDLDRPVDALFDSLGGEPISAASLGQVYKGRLKDGRSVAVKVQRPGLREQITLDLYVVRHIGVFLNRTIRLVRSDLGGLVDELGRRVFEEMDYLHEADNAEIFARLHDHNPRIAVPIIHRHLTSRRVLTMEWIEGTKLTQLEEVRALGLDPNEMIRIGVNCSLEQLLEHGFFHADPHPGNLLALADGRLAYLDFGMMSEVTRQSRTGLIQAVVHLVNRDFKALSDDFVTLGFLSEDVDLRPIIPAFEQVFNKALEVGVNRMDFKAVSDDLSGVMYRFPFRVPPYYALIIRSLVTLEGIALSIDPDFKILGAAYPYFATRLLMDPDPALRSSLRAMLYDKDVFRWNRLDELLVSASQDQNLNLENLLDETLDFLFSAQAGLLRQQLVDGLVNSIDGLGWQAARKLMQRLPQKLQPPGLAETAWATELGGADTQTIRELLLILRKLPGFEPSLLWQRLPRVLGEPALREMGVNLALGLAERSLVRLVRDIVVPQQRASQSLGSA